MTSILKKYLYLLVIFASLILISYICFARLLKSKNSKSYALKGLLLDLNTKDILAMSTILVNFLLLSYFLIFKLEINMALLICSNLLLIVYFILSISYRTFINILINVFNILIIYLNNYVLMLNKTIDFKAYLATQICVNAFGILFFIFTHIKFIKNIAIKGDNHGYEKTN